MAESPLMAVLTKLRFSAPSHPEKIENGLYESFIAVIQDDVQGGLWWMLDQRQCADLDRVHTIHFSTLRCSSRSQPVWIVIRLLQESDPTNTHTGSMGTERQRPSPRPTLILYYLARLVRYRAK